MSLNFVVTARKLAPAGLALLEESECRVSFAETGEELASVLRNEPIDAIISRTLPLSRDLIASAGKRLRVISRHGAGADNVDVTAATERQIPVLVAASANATSVVELTIGLMISAARGIAQHDAAIRKGKWDRSKNGRQLAGSRLGIVGYGEIGRGVARVAIAMGMRVAVFDPAIDPNAVPETVNVMATLRDLLERSDVLTLHCPLTAKTRGLIGHNELTLLPAGAIVINTARGPLIDETALLNAIASDRVIAAGLDTFQVEPLPSDSALRGVTNVVMTPHMGGSTSQAAAQTAAMAVRNALRVLRGESVEPHLCVNPTTLLVRETI